jgi:hypothetical protein
MKHVTDLPHEVREIENAWIAMPDGARLAARIWLPEDAEDRPVPAILEFIPYRKRFGTAARDEVTHRYLAGHGYVCARVDLRGSGESDGVLKDEYLQQELDDGAAVIDWLASQPWCDGSVGMMGISWGGFNALQVAALRPPALKAVVSLCSTDDRYADDVHFMGGCLLGDNLSWASTMFAYNSLPPDPALVGDRWRQMWFDRLEGSGLWIAKWLSHQRRGGYWKHGSVCETPEAIEVPILAVSGWADGYSNAVFRMSQVLTAPVWGLVGPWSHKYPHFGIPGPPIDFLGEMLRWWGRWLKGQETGIEHEPRLRVWMQDSVPPTTSYIERPGRWVAEDRWPSDRIEERHFALTRHHLVPEGTQVEPAEVSIRSPVTTGLFAGKWCSYSAGPDLAHDQRHEDGGAWVFQSAPLEEDMEMLGAVRAELELAVDQPVAMIAVRLSDVRPDDSVTRVTYGLLNLTHRESNEHPKPMEPGTRTKVTVHLNEAAHRFPRGHKLRIAVSTAYWPLAWPAPRPVSLTIFNETSSICLPVRPPRQEDEQLSRFGDPVGAPPPAKTVKRGEQHNWRVQRDLATDTATLEVIDDRGCYVLDDIDLEVSTLAKEWYTVVGDDVDTVRGETLWQRDLARGDWRISTVTRTVLTSTATHFHVHAQLDAYEGDRRVYSRNWDEAIARDCV